MRKVIFAWMPRASAVSLERAALSAIFPSSSKEMNRDCVDSCRSCQIDKGSLKLDLPRRAGRIHLFIRAPVRINAGAKAANLLPPWRARSPASSLTRTSSFG